jgi:hypothetical protein
MPAVSTKFLISRACRSDDSGLQAFHAPAPGADRDGRLWPGGDLS